MRNKHNWRDRKDRPKKYKCSKRTYKENRQGYTFRCCHCRNIVGSNPDMGTIHRNHCNLCLWSRHVDTKPGNGLCDCNGAMEPVAMTFKHAGFDRYGNRRVGDVMIVHICRSCDHININRIAADDNIDEVVDIFKRSQNLDGKILGRFSVQGIEVLNEDDLGLFRTALFGRI